MSFSQLKNEETKITSTCATCATKWLQQESIQEENQGQTPQKLTVKTSSSNHQHILMIDESLTQIINLSQEAYSSVNSGDLNICKLLRYLWSDDSQAKILRMHYFSSINRKQINQNMKKLKERLSKFNIKVQQLQQFILILFNDDQPLKQQFQIKGQQQVQTQIIKIGSHTKCRLGLINIELFKEDNWEFSKRNTKIQFIKHRRRQCFKKFLKNINIVEELIPRIGPQLQLLKQQINIISGKIQIALILSERCQIQFILKFASIKQLLQVYEQSFNNIQFGQFFKLQPFNQAQSERSSIISIKMDNINDLSLGIQKILKNDGLMRKFNQYYQQNQKLGNQTNEGAIKINFNNVSRKQIFRRKNYLQSQQKQLSQNLTKQKREIQKKYQFQKANWGSPSNRNNGLYDLQDMFQNQQINKELAESHIFRLRQWMNQNFMEAVKDMVKNLQVYASLKGEITKFIKINQYKWFRAKQLYQKIYPQMPALIKYFLNKTGIPTIQKQLDQFIKDSNMKAQIYQTNISKIKQKYFQKLKQNLGIKSQHFLDQIYYEYLKIQQNTNKQNKIIVLVNTNEIISLQQALDLLDIFSTNLSHELDILNTILYEYKINSLDTNKEINKMDCEKYSLNILSYQQILDTQCLGCIPFFYEKLHIKDDKINKMLVSSFQSIQHLKKQEINIKREICSMMNAGGGVIMFDCIHKYTQIQPCGTYITQKDKQKYEQQIYSYLNCFHPIIEIGTNILVSFVPVLRKPYKRKSKDYINQNQDTLNYIKGCYVTRIKVCPTDATQIYFWKHEQKEKYYWSYKYNGKIKQMPYHSAYKLLKQRFNEFYIPNFYTNRQRRMMQKQNNFFGHICKKPELGVPIAEANRQQGQRIIKESTSFVNFQRRYTYISMIIAKNNDHEAIKRKFQSRGIKCEIEEKFKKYKFKNAKNTAVIYHNTRFENLLSIVSFNPEFQFNTKMVLLIRVTEYIKLMNRNEKSYLSVDEYKHLCEWLKAEFPHQKLQVFQFRALGKVTTKQFYISTGSKMSTVFMYFVLNHFQEKAIFKNPVNLDQFSEQQKKNVWFQLTNEYDEKVKITIERERQRS